MARRCEAGDRHSAERGTERARNIHTNAVGGDGGRQVLLGNELRHDRLPRRYGQGSGGADKEREQQQISGRSPTKAYDHRIDRGNYRRQRLNDDQELALVKNVRECSCG